MTVTRNGVHVIKKGMMRTLGRRILLLTAISGLMTACMRAPTVDVTGVRLGGIGFRGITLIAQLSVDNPNRFALETDSITFVLEARDPTQPGSWTPVTSGTNTQHFRVEKQSAAPVEIPIQFGYSGLSMPVRSIIENGMLNYRVSGAVFVRKPLRKTIPFSEEGNLAVGTTTP